MHRKSLPTPFDTMPFTVRSARDAGVGEGRLRNPELVRPFRGVRSEEVGGGTIIDRCNAYVPLLRNGQFFSHVTAALLWGWPTPERIEDAASLHVTANRAPRGRGIIGHWERSNPESSTRGLPARITGQDIRHGLPVSDPVRAFFELASILQLSDLVAVADSIILDPAQLDPLDLRPHATLEELRRGLQNFSGRGARNAASALLLARQGAESRPETLLRLLLIGANLPEPELNVWVTDAAGRRLGRGDLVYRKYRTLVEYDGDGHRANVRQYDRDIMRIEDFVFAGWSVVRVRKRGLFVNPDATVARVTRALVAGGWRA